MKQVTITITYEGTQKDMTMIEKLTNDEFESVLSETICDHLNAQHHSTSDDFSFNIEIK